jgi:hypothetical protein
VVPAATRGLLLWQLRTLVCCSLSSSPSPSPLSTSGPLYLAASTLSAFCGRHRYQTQDEAFVRVLERNPVALVRVEEALDSEALLFEPLLRALDVTPPPTATPTQHAQTLLREESELGQRARKLLAEARPATPADVEALRQARPRTQETLLQVKGAVRALKEHQAVVGATKLPEAVKAASDRRASEVVTSLGLSEEATTRLLRDVVALSIMDRGSQLESQTVQSVLDLYKDAIELEKLQARREMRLRVDDTEVVIQGVVDMQARLVGGKGSVALEIKNRQRRFMVPAPEYDLDQLTYYTIAGEDEEGTWCLTLAVPTTQH